MTTSKKTFLVVASAAILGLLVSAYYLYSPGHAPAGQPPLARLNSESYGAFQELFDASAGNTRVLVMLSPT